MTLLLLFLCLALSAAYSAAETALYGLSRMRLEVDAGRGRPLARLIHRLVQADSALLATILIGNNLMLELVSELAGHVIDGPFRGEQANAVFLTLILAPIVFFLGEALPKEFSRRHPHGLIQAVTPVLVLSRGIFWPVERLLSFLSFLLGRLLRLPAEGPALLHGRAAALRALEEGARDGALSQRATDLARNALGLRSAPVRRCMTAWPLVECLRSDGRPEEIRESLRRGEHSRLPVLSREGVVLGYVHALEVLADPSRSLAEALRPLPEVAPDLPIARALLELRGGGRRLALVGSSTRPLGLVSLKDLLEEVTGEVAGL